MKRLAILLLSVCLLTSCDRSSEGIRQEVSAGRDEAPTIQAMKDQLAVVEPGTPRSEVLRVAGLTEADGAKRISYYADPCGSMEHWITNTGDKIYVQGHFFDQDGYREEPYIIGVLRLAEESESKDVVIWSGLNLQTGTDMFANVTINGEQGGAGQPATRSESK